MPPSASSFALAVTLGQDSFSASGKHDLVLKAYWALVVRMEMAVGGRRGLQRPTSSLYRRSLQTTNSAPAKAFR
jgi:hypothetical protein